MRRDTLKLIFLICGSTKPIKSGHKMKGSAPCRYPCALSINTISVLGDHRGWYLRLKTIYKSISNCVNHVSIYGMTLLKIYYYVTFCSINESVGNKWEISKNGSKHFFIQCHLDSKLSMTFIFQANEPNIYVA